MVLGVILESFGGLGDTFSDFLRVLEAGLKFDDFSGIPWEGPDPENMPS